MGGHERDSGGPRPEGPVAGSARSVARELTAAGWVEEGAGTLRDPDSGTRVLLVVSDTALLAVVHDENQPATTARVVPLATSASPSDVARGLRSLVAAGP